MSEKKKQVWIPSTTSKTIIFPLSEPTNTFETGSYDPSLLNNQVSHEEINQFIPKINPLCSQLDFFLFCCTESVLLRIYNLSRKCQKNSQKEKKLSEKTKTFQKKNHSFFFSLFCFFGRK